MCRGMAKLSRSDKRRIKEIGIWLLRNGSHSRAPALIEAIWREPPKIFWSVFLAEFDGCDDQFWYRSDFLAMLRFYAEREPVRSYMDTKTGRWFDALPPTIDIYRGTVSAGDKIPQ